MPFFECERLCDSRASAPYREVVVAAFFFFFCAKSSVLSACHQPLTLCHLIQTH